VSVDVLPSPLPAAPPTRSWANHLACRVESGRLVVERDGRLAVAHPLWVRERSRSVGAIDPVNRQRLTEPLDVADDLAVVSADVMSATTGDMEAAMSVVFSDGHRMHLTASDIGELFGDVDDDAPPAPTPWIGSEIEVPLTDYRALTDPGCADATMSETLDHFFRLGFFVLRNTPATPEALHEIASRFGRISATNFGTLFDVRTEPIPVDLAYTPVALTAHTDQPYRRPVPGIQFLHTIANDASGGASTMVDGMAAVRALRADDPEAFDVLSTLPIEFRYDIGTDVKVGRSPIIELDLDGALRRLRYSPRLDFAPGADPDVLDVYYRGRRWLADRLNSADHLLRLRMVAGDVLVVDNHRVLHGREAFDPTRGHRHLQGCYIDHDGPDTLWRLLRRRDDRPIGLR